MDKIGGFSPGYVIDRSLGVLPGAICQVPWESHVR